MTNLKPWAIDTGIRAVKTFAQSLVALLGLHAVNVVNVNWQHDLGIAAGAAVVCILQNIQRLPYDAPAAPVVPDTPDPAAIVDAGVADAAATPAAPVVEPAPAAPVPAPAETPASA